MSDDRNYRFTISYDGRRYHGWEKKSNVSTIEGRLEAVLSKMTGVDVDIHGAGRTDAGVHARAMTASGRLCTDKSPDEIKAYMNNYLPADICVTDVSAAGERFHARLNATGKVYEYVLYVGREKPVFDRDYVWTVPDGYLLDEESMRSAAMYLAGTHDFKAFCGNNRMKKSTVRTIYDITVERRGDYLHLAYHGNGFLQNMVRILTGTLVEVGMGRIKASDIPGIIESRDRQQAGPTAPPHGLTLVKVEYS